MEVGNIVTVININCKCGHYQYAHDFGKEKCRVRGCKCKEYKEVTNEEQDTPSPKTGAYSRIR